MFKFILLACFVSAIAAYDFKDSAYNEYVMQDIMDLAEDSDVALPAFRFKREAVPSQADAEKDDDKKCKQGKNKPSKHFYKCCKEDSNDAAHEQFKDMKKQCLSEMRGEQTGAEMVDMFSCEKMNRTKEEYICVTECVGKKLNILDKSGNLIDAAAMEHVKNDLSKAKWQKDIAETVAKKCLAEAKQTTEAKPEDAAATKKEATPTVTPTAATDKKETTTVAAAVADKKEEAKCNGASLKFAHCVWREFTKSCPADKQSDSKKCSALREKLAKGEDVDFLSGGGGDGHHHHYHHKSHHRSSGNRRDD